MLQGMEEGYKVGEKLGHLRATHVDVAQFLLKVVQDDPIRHQLRWKQFLSL